MPDQFITPPDHVNFLAKPLFGAEGAIRDGAIARLAPQGGGPTTPHTHAHDHLFIVVKGEERYFKPFRVNSKGEYEFKKPFRNMLRIIEDEEESLEQEGDNPFINDGDEEID